MTALRSRKGKRAYWRKTNRQSLAFIYTNGHTYDMDLTVSTSNICCRVKLLEVSDAVVDNVGAADENS